MTWMKTVQNNRDSHGLSWTDAVDLAQNRPLWRLLATSGITHSWCKPEKKKKTLCILYFLVFQGSGNVFSHVTAVLGNMPFNKEDHIFIKNFNLLKA